MISKEAVNSYLEALIWTNTLKAEGGSIEYEGTTYEDGCPLDSFLDSSDDVVKKALFEEAETDLENFRLYCLEEIGIDPFRFFSETQVAHDFCLSRNGHGAGFFDDSFCVTTIGPRDLGAERKFELNDELQAAAETFGTHGVAAWVEDGVLHVEGHS